MAMHVRKTVVQWEEQHALDADIATTYEAHRLHQHGQAWLVANARMLYRLRRGHLVYDGWAYHLDGLGEVHRSRAAVNPHHRVRAKYDMGGLPISEA